MLFDKMEKNMQEHVDGVWKNKEVLPDLRYDVDSIADYLTLKLGATKEEVMAPSGTKCQVGI